MRRLTIVSAMMLGTSAAPAANVTATWVPPSSRVDGTPLSISELAQFNFYCSASSGGPYSLIATAPNTATSVTATSCVSDGIGYFVVAAVDTSGNRSAYSNEASKILSSIDPNAPAVPACVEPPRKYYVYGYASQTYVSLYDDAVKKVIGWAKAFDFQGFPRVCEGDSTTVFTAQAWLYTTDDETGERGKALCQRWDR